MYLYETPITNTSEIIFEEDTYTTIATLEATAEYLNKLRCCYFNDYFDRMCSALDIGKDFLPNSLLKRPIMISAKYAINKFCPFIRWHYFKGNLQQAN